jgi:putative NIF3 family GTP cyclohydrolase 1 type 2
MDSLAKIAEQLDNFFQVAKLDRDPAFSRFVPQVYDALGFDWRTFFEADFTRRFNGLVVRGEEVVNCVFCASFPHQEVLQIFLRDAQPGDLLFSHHPIDMRCGDPRGAWSEGMKAIDPATLTLLKKRKLSFYACHAPLDYNREISTSLAIAEALNVSVEGEFLPYGNGFAGLVGSIAPLSTEDLAEKLKGIFEIPYLDQEGPLLPAISKVAIVAGCGDRVADMKEVQGKGVHAYVTGEIHCHIDNAYGRQRFEEMKTYSASTTMSLLGVSHAASEYLVMKQNMAPWFVSNFQVKVQSIPETKWWR